MFLENRNFENPNFGNLKISTMIDIRSDTITLPTDEMRSAMMNAPVGDDVYGEDPTVNELQNYTADLLGKEAALFVPSGVMGNQLCIKIHTNSGDEVIVDSESHIFHYETAAPSVISSVQLHCVQSNGGIPNLEALRNAIRPAPYYYPRSTLLCLENTHNRYGGTIIPLDSIKQVEALARENGMAFHCDGARFWNACAATGISPKEYAKPFDTLSVCLSKGLGAPVGSIIVGTREHIEKARHWRKLLGGGMRQVGFLAAAGLYALKFHREKLVQDHKNAKIFATILAEKPNFELDSDSVQTNIVAFRIPDAQFIEQCKKNGVLISASREGYARAVFNLNIAENEAEIAAQTVVSSLK